ncbi:hypothetical protein Tco_1496349, partial [Tanacetum coccineum]
KVKKGKLGGDEDDLSMLLPGFSSGFDSLDEASDENIKKKVLKKKRKKKLEQKVDPEITSDDVAEELEPENETTSVADMDSENNNAQVPVTEKQVKYVPPHLRSKARNESEEFSQVCKRVRGFIYEPEVDLRKIPIIIQLKTRKLNLAKRNAKKLEKRRIRKNTSH